MEVRNKVEIVVKNEKYECNFTCQSDCPLGFLFDSLCQMRQYIFEQIQKNIEEKKEEGKEIE